MTVSREVRLISRPAGAPSAANLEMARVELAAPAKGEVQVRNTWMAVDPAMRGRMSDAKSYIPPFVLGAAMEGPALGEVTLSNDPAFKPGDLVFSRLGWRDAFNTLAKNLQKIDTRGLPPQVFLGAAGSSGLTAYVGLMRIAAMKPGDVVFVSAASGAVGSMACQIAKLKGHKVIGSAGGPKKVAFLKDVLGVDEAIDYKAEPSLTKALAKAAPEGIDVYFDNVGGEHLHAALAIANRGARFALCGMISQYNATAPSPGPRNLMQVVIKGLRLEGYVVLFHMDMEEAFLAEVIPWLQTGKLKYQETVYNGLDKAADAFFGLFTGENLGRTLVKLS